MRPFYAQVTTDGALRIVERERFVEFAESNPGCEVRIDPMQDISPQARKFFEGGIIPFFFWQQYDPDGGLVYKSYDEARNALKLEFAAEYTLDLKTHKRKKVAGSTAEMTDSQFKEKFINPILRWMEENGFDLPDSEDYNYWHENAPASEKIYPPVLRLMRVALRMCGKKAIRALDISRSIKVILDVEKNYKIKN